MMSPIAGRLADLRSAMARHKVDATIIPSSDPHLSEYLPERWQGRRWLSGFTGSVGTLVVTPDFAGLWIDSRYWTEAERELKDTGIAVMRIATAAAPAHIDWLVQHIASSGVVGVDGNVLSLAGARELKKALAARNITLRTDLDLVDGIWAERPKLPKDAIYEHKPPHAVISRPDKLSRIRLEMARLGADWHLVSTLDDIAWIFYLRGSDVQYNPVFVAHALISQKSATLFVAAGKVFQLLEADLAKDGVLVVEYGSGKDVLTVLALTSSVLIYPERVTLVLS